MCGIVKLCYRSLWSSIVTGVFMVVFLSLSAWMWLYRSRQSRHVIIRACVCLAQLTSLIAFARNEVVAGLFGGVTYGLNFIALFGWAWNAARVAFMTIRLANEAPPWLPRYTMTMQIVAGFSFPLLALIGGVHTAATCVSVATIAQLLMIVMMYGVGLPVFVSHFKIRKVINKHRESMRSMGTTAESSKDVERDNKYKKPMRTLLHQSVFMALLISVVTILFARSIRGLVSEDVRDTFDTACETGREAARVAGFHLWQILILWSSNVTGARRKLEAVKTGEPRSSTATRPSACSQQSSPQYHDVAPGTAHGV